MCELCKRVVRGFIVLDLLVVGIYWVVVVVFFVVVVVLVIVDDYFIVYFLVFNFVINGLNDVRGVGICDVVWFVMVIKWGNWFVEVCLNVIVVDVCGYYEY